ncbi:MAG: exodeoxyribonuclease large subunit [Bacteroidetes bacterium]|nr:exodeoxyribonuclease large subunit [Bacteroidota bacterium]
MALEPLALTVTEVTKRIKHSIESSFSSVVVQGEISNFKRHTSGHIYFTLKDEGAQISAVLWRSRSHGLSFQPEDGTKVIVTGRLTLYEVRGVYQIEVSSIRPVGIGELQVAFEYLKRKLAAEGLFDAEHKKSLPEYPERIGIITSPSGAALHDMLNVFRRRFPAVEIILRPTIVQGAGAPDDIARAISELNDVGNIDVIILGRGGGSIEDLWAFNEERVARAIFNSKIPIVSAVGHEIDFTIADFAADLRAPTPSAAAELVVRDRNAVLANVRDYWYTIHETMTTMLNHRKEHVRHLLRTYSFNKPIDLLRQYSQRVDELDRGLSGTVSHRIALLKSSSQSLRHRIAALDPGLVLRRGYTMVYRAERIIGSAKRLSAGDSVDIRFSDGVVSSKVL